MCENLHYESVSFKEPHKEQEYYLTILFLARARMGSESIAHEAEGLMGYWLVGQKYRDKTT